MNTKSIIEQLIKSIEDKNEDAILHSENFISKNIADAAKEPLFYYLPFDKISVIIKKANFGENDSIKDPIALLQTLIQKTREVHQKEAVLLLNDLKTESLPKLTLDVIISIVSKFTKCEFLTTLGEIYTKEESSVIPDYEYTIETLQEELKQKTKEIREIGEKNKALQRKIPKFPPVVKKPSNFTPDIHKASRNGKLNIIQYLCEVIKVNPEETDREGWTPLHYACNRGYLNIAQYLCEVQKVNAEAKDKWKETPLHLACIQNHLPIVKYLCENREVNTEAKNNDGYTPLHYACQFGHLPIVQYLCEVAKVSTRGAYENAPYGKVKEYLKKYLSM